MDGWITGPDPFRHARSQKSPGGTVDPVGRQRCGKTSTWDVLHSLLKGYPVHAVLTTTATTVTSAETAQHHTSATFSRSGPLFSLTFKRVFQEASGLGGGAQPGWEIVGQHV